MHSASLELGRALGPALRAALTLGVNWVLHYRRLPPHPPQLATDSVPELLGDPLGVVDGTQAGGCQTQAQCWEKHLIAALGVELGLPTGGCHWGCCPVPTRHPRGHTQRKQWGHCSATSWESYWDLSLELRWEKPFGLPRSSTSKVGDSGHCRGSTGTKHLAGWSVLARPAGTTIRLHWVLHSGSAGAGATRRRNSGWRLG
jgi:hypothetical protein